MNKLAGAAVFVVTLAAALVVTNYYNPRPSAPPLPPPDPPAEAAATTPAPPSRSEITYNVRLVTLDVPGRKSHTTLSVEYPAYVTDTPDRLWVWTAFFVPGEPDGEVFAGEPVLVEKPFPPRSNHTILSVTAACAWCGRRDAPAAGYYARVYVSPYSAAAARTDAARVTRDIRPMTQVVVEEGRRKMR